MINIEANITETDIAHGEQLDGSKCPISLSVRRALGDNFDVVHVSYGSIFAKDSNGQCYESKNLPKEVTEFIIDFDTKGASVVTPQNFKISFKEFESKNIFSDIQEKVLEDLEEVGADV